MAKENPRILLIGPGAIGLTVAAALLDGGHDLTIAARTGFDTLSLTYSPTDAPTESFTYEPTVLTSPTATTFDPTFDPTFDMVLVATKAHQTASAGAWLTQSTDSDTTVVAFQNGIEHEATLRPLLPAAAPVVPVVVRCPARRTEPGRVVVGGSARFDVPLTDAAAEVARLFDGSFAKMNVVEDWQTSAWLKLLMNSASGILTVLTGKPISVLRDPEAARLMVALLEEAATVGRAEGAQLPDDTAPRMVEAMVAQAAGHLPSIAADRVAGKPTEWRVRNDVILRLAAKHDINVPLHQAGTTLIRLGEPDDQD